MADAPILGGTTKLKLDEAIFGEGLNKSLIHESVRAELNARRRGTAATKTRGSVPSLNCVWRVLRPEL